jgi:NAD(P)-dependent dehydrogenase (short-subunit alcohol dehydrogenase family)
MSLAEPPGADDPMLPADEFAGQVVLITGGGSGVGLAMARGFARCGADVAIAGRNPDKLDGAAIALRALGTRVLPISLDVRQPDAVRSAYDRIEAELGPVAVLANNAGANFPATADRISPNGWRAIMQIALDGTFYCAQEFHRRRVAAGLSGAVLNNLANYAWTGLPGDAHSSAAKAAAMNLTMTLATEWAGQGIRVNGLVIGTYPHPGVVHVDASIDGARGRSIPAGRALREQELGWIAAFLCSRFAGYMTGASLAIDGGDWLRRDVQKPAFVPMADRQALWLD